MVSAVFAATLALSACGAAAVYLPGSQPKDYTTGEKVRRLYH